MWVELGKRGIPIGESTVRLLVRKLRKPIKIDSKSGDVNTVDISILQMKDQKESFLKPYPVA